MRFVFVRRLEGSSCPLIDQRAVDSYICSSRAAIYGRAVAVIKIGVSAVLMLIESLHERDVSLAK